MKKMLAIAFAIVIGLSGSAFALTDDGVAITDDGVAITDDGGSADLAPGQDDGLVRVEPKEETKEDDSLAADFVRYVLCVIKGDDTVVCVLR